MRHNAGQGGGRTRKAFVVLAVFGLGGCASVDRVAYVPPAHTAARPPARTTRNGTSVQTLNAGMLPGFMGSNNVERAERICDRLTTYQPADVIVLLEVYDERARGVFIRRLRDRWPWIVRRSGGGALLPEDSGILLASRLPIVTDGAPRIAFRSFRERGPLTCSDYWAAKGVLGTEIDLGDGCSLCILAAHLMADYEVIGQYEYVRRRQLQEVVEFGRQFLAGIPAGRRSSALLVGDLNVPAERVVPAGSGPGSRLEPTAEYRHMLAVLRQSTDLYRATHAHDAGWTWNHDPYAPGADPALGPWRLDYAFGLSDFVPEERARELPFVRTSLMSQAPGIADHRGVLLELGPHEPTSARVAQASRRTAPVAVAAAPARQPDFVLARIDD